MSQLAQQHQWHLASHVADKFGDHSAGSSGIAISAVCAVCGLARVQVIATRGDQYVDLRGDCLGTPQEPGEPRQGEWPYVAALRDDDPE